MKNAFLLIAILAIAAHPASADIILSADFAGKTVDQAIGNGGPAVGEPASQSSAGIVRSAPFPTNCLEYTDTVTAGTPIAYFDFLGDVELTTGTLTISADLWFNELDNFYFSIRENGGASQSFNSIRFVGTGSVSVSDKAGNLGTVGSYTAGRAYSLRLEHDLDAGTYDLWWDGVRIVEGRAHGVTERGIGSVLTGISNDLDTVGTYWIDNILVETSESVSTEASSWGVVKAGWE